MRIELPSFNPEKDLAIGEWEVIMGNFRASLNSGDTWDMFGKWSRAIDCGRNIHLLSPNKLEQTTKIDLLNGYQKVLNGFQRGLESGHMDWEWRREFIHMSCSMGIIDSNRFRQVSFPPEILDDITNEFKFDQRNGISIAILKNYYALNVLCPDVAQKTKLTKNSLTSCKSFVISILDIKRFISKKPPFLLNLLLNLLYISPETYISVIRDRKSDVEQIYNYLETKRYEPDETEDLAHNLLLMTMLTARNPRIIDNKLQSLST